MSLSTVTGNVIGRTPHFIVEATPHSLNLFAVLVGATSKGRKGTALDHVKHLFRQVSAAWLDSRVQSGLSSGEGLIWAVRDPIADQAGDIIDPGVSDKRLVVLEQEFASTLKMLQREGNVLSATVRLAWDSGNLQILTKNSPATATGAHISIVGHISAIELRRELDSSSAANGFGNRFLWGCVRRSKILPDGGRLDPRKLEPLIAELQHVVNNFAKGVTEIRRDDEARTLWYEVYERLSEGRPGLAGGLTARAEAQVMRLACIYAVLDQSHVVRVHHLKAALALWRFLDDSVRFLFKDALGDPVADRILAALRDKKPEPFSRTAIRDLLGRHATAEVIDRALEQLAGFGLAKSERQETAGRPVEYWRAI